DMAEQPAAAGPTTKTPVVRPAARWLQPVRMRSVDSGRADVENSLEFASHDRRPPREIAKTTLLKRLILRPELSFIMEAHNGLSARIAEEAGFEAVWASGLSIS